VGGLEHAAILPSPAPAGKGLARTDAPVLAAPAVSDTTVSPDRQPGGLEWARVLGQGAGWG